MMPHDSPRDLARFFAEIPLHNEPGPAAGKYASVFDGEKEVVGFDTGDAHYDERLALILRTAPAALGVLTHLEAELEGLSREPRAEAIRAAVAGLRDRIGAYLDLPVHALQARSVPPHAAVAPFPR